jgi:gamma-glutamyltranspeptidase/glutathione hydrolase
MRNLHSDGHRRGVVAAPHPAAVESGRAVLAEGGNAVEAMIAMAATIAVVAPHMNHVGGDGFWLIREASGRVRALMAAGRAGAKARPELYREQGYDKIPERWPLAAATVPGTVSGWALALEAATAYGGRLPLSRLLEDAIGCARAGIAASPALSHEITLRAAELKNVPGFADLFLPEGKPLAAGALLKQPALAAMLDQLAHAGLADFYRGDVAREIAADLDTLGSPVTRADLHHHRALVVEPLELELGTGRIYNTPPPTQGLAALLILGIHERLRVNQAEGFDHVHGLVEASKRAFRLRDRYVTDPDDITHPADPYLTSRFLAAEAGAIDRRKAADWNPAGKFGDTVWMGAADTSGLVVSFLQSIYWEFGSGVVLPRTGLLMQNRAASFSLDPRALNKIAPGRLPFHTLNPAIAVLKDGRVMAYGSMGGDGQPQFQAALFTRHVLYRQPLDQAIDAPRWLLGRTWGETHAKLRLEPRFDDALVEQLIAAGHDVELVNKPYSELLGHLGAVVLHPDGRAEGAHDPRAEGGAAGA